MIGIFILKAKPEDKKLIVEDVIEQSKKQGRTIKRIGEE